MITLTESTDYDLIKSIISDPVLYQLTYGQTTDLKDFEVKKDFTYLLIKEEEEVLGCFQAKHFTNAVLEYHAYILPKYWGTEVAREAGDLGHSWAKEKGYGKVYTTVPATCIHVLKALQKRNYNCCGMIEKGIIHNNILCTLFFYEFEV